MKKKILKRYKDDPDNWFEVDEKDVIKCCEDGGYWKKGTSLKVLYETGKIWTAFSEWKISMSMDISFINDIK